MKFNSRKLVAMSCLLLLFTFFNPISVSATDQPAPTNIIATAKYVPATSTTTAKKGIEVRWTAPSLVEKYDIFRASVLTGTYVRIKTVSAPSSSYFDTNISEGVTYYYYVQAYHTPFLSSPHRSPYTKTVNARYLASAKVATNALLYKPVIWGPTSKINVSVLSRFAPYLATYQGVVFTSSNSNVCAVSSNGILTGKSLGTATITITSIESPTIKSLITCSPVKYLRPAAGAITSPFGNRTHPVTGMPDFHYGIDISKNPSLRIVATREGVVTTVQNVSIDGRGKFIDIDHGDGIVSRYQHLDELYVTKGQRVIQGQQIAKMGSTGVGTGVHLHFELSINGTRVNPLNYINMNSTFVCTSGCR